MTPQFSARLKVVLQAISDCNTNGATKRYQEALTQEYQASRAREDATADFEVAARALRRLVAQRFDVVVGRQYYRETSVSQGYATAHDVRPPVVRPYLTIRAYARCQATIERRLWPTHPQHIENVLWQIKSALICLEQDPPERRTT